MEQYQSQSLPYAGLTVPSPDDLSPQKNPNDINPHGEQQFALDLQLASGLQSASELSAEEAVLYCAESDAAAIEGGDVEMESIWVSMSNGEQLHLRRLALSSESQLSDSRLDQAAGAFSSALEEPRQRRVFMLHGEAECGGIFYHLSGRGLAHYLARCGYEVFVADLGARGRSLVTDGGASTLTVHQLIVEAIPRLLRAVEQHAPLTCRHREKYSQPASVWVGHGFGGVLLSAAWARMAPAERCAERMVFFGARRKLTAGHRLARAFVRAFRHPLTARLITWCKVFPAVRLRLGSADENAGWFRVYADWLGSDDWIDSEDGFDYRAALAQSGFPPTLHFAASGDTVYANPSDVRQFVEEIGPHDARLLLLDRVTGSGEQYDHLKMLLHPSAEQDAFDDLAHWLSSLEPGAVDAPVDVAVEVSQDESREVASEDVAVSVALESEEMLAERQENLVLCA